MFNPDPDCQITIGTVEPTQFIPTAGQKVPIKTDVSSLKLWDSDKN
jgi:hypothetical protein